jgi:hypothetical protein
LAGDPRILWSGYIKGGLNAGPESVLLDYLRKNSFTNSTTEQEAQTTLRNIFNYPEGTILRGSPDWDLAAWAQRLPTSQIQSYGAGGSHINDWINFTYSRYENTPGPTTNSNLTKYGFGTESAAANTPVSTEGRMINSYPSKYTTNNGGYYSMPFVKKTFTVIKPTWAQDVRVDARLFNCCPLSFAGTSFHDAAARAPAAKIANIWTSKKTLNSTSIEITIFVSWAIDLSTPDNNGNGVKLPSMNRNQLGLYNGFAVITPDMVAESDQDMEGVFYGTTQSSWTGTYERGSTLGVCVYPTVQFDIIGVPAGRGANVDYFYQSNTTINLTQA